VKVRKQDVPITTVYEIDCNVCGKAVYPDDRVTSPEEARQVRDAHIAEHERGEL
jgi:predicted nucleic acid-binding Zn ribbon protein